MNRNPNAFTIQLGQRQQEIMSLDHVRLIGFKQLHCRSFGMKEGADNEVELGVC